ncbi:beta-ketoacyl reductase [Actinomadura yumaensis]|uniref:type I polyketide synthase n=1 Tax=Actinomadura yumaensis TaxID=111807 RepID=UPI003622FCFA
MLITGGTGTLGGLVAEHVVGTWGVKRLVLASRRGLQAPGADELVERLTRELGAEVRVVAADVSDADAVTDLITATDADPAHPLTGLVHTAGLIDDAVIGSQTPERLHHVWDAKATAAHNLHTATRHLPLAAFVIFSSSAAMLGSPGQGNYAAANAYCDALAARRQAAGLPAVSVGWGLWEATSAMTGSLTETDRARMSRSGVGALPNEHGLALLDAALRHGDASLLAANLDLRALAVQPAESLPGALRALVSGGGERVRRTAATGSARPDDWAGRLAGMSAAEQQRAMLNLVRGHVATVLGRTDADSVRGDASFKELGFDSLTGVELRNRLADATGLRLPPALVFDYPQAGVLAEHLRTRLVPEGADASAAGAGVEPVLDDLARLESTLNAAAALEDGDSDAVTARLESLLTHWRAVRSGRAANGHHGRNGHAEPSGNDGQNGHDGQDGEDGTAVDRLESASADQVLDFIDNELGVSWNGPDATTTR